MLSFRMKGFGLICLAMAVGGVLSGCGGSSGSGMPQSPTISATGGVNSQSGTSSTGATQSTVPQQVPVTTASGTVTATVPPGESFSAGTPVSVIFGGQPIITGVTYAAKTRAQGDVLVDGQESGVTVLPDGSLSGNLILTQGNHTLTAQGPFNISNNSNTLTVQTFNFGVVVLADGNGSMPVALTMRLPANDTGSVTSNGNFVNVTYATPDFAGGSGTLTISWPGVVKDQKKAVIKGVANYADLNFQPNDAIPAGGVSTVTFNYTTGP